LIAKLTKGLVISRKVSFPWWIWDYLRVEFVAHKLIFEFPGFAISVLFGGVSNITLSRGLKMMGFISSTCFSDVP